MDGARTPWTILQRRYLYRSPHRDLVVEQVRSHTGAEAEYAYMETPEAVLVVPLTVDGRVVLVRQYRQPVRAWVLEVPAGSVGDEPPVAAARRELAEEIGGSCADLAAVATFYGMPSAVTGRHHVYLATGVALGDTRHESTELIEVVPVAPDEAFAWARDGRVSNAACALALLLCEPALLLCEPLVRRRLGG